MHGCNILFLMSITGNNWGCDSTGCGMGLGKQENFVNCADIAILNDCSGSVTPPPRTSSPSSQSTPTPTPTVTISSPTTGQTTPTGKLASKFVGLFFPFPCRK